MPPRARKNTAEPLGFEDVLWKTADKLRGLRRLPDVGALDLRQLDLAVLHLPEKRRQILVRLLDSHPSPLSSPDGATSTLPHISNSMHGRVDRRRPVIAPFSTCSPTRPRPRPRRVGIVR